MERKNCCSNTLKFDLGTFEGFNFRAQCAINRTLSADEIISWDHDEQGEAEFWPSGDSPGVALIFKGSAAVTASELRELDRLLDELGDDSIENFLRIHIAQDSHGGDLASLSGSEIEEQNTHIFIGSSFIDLQREAAFELFESYYPDEYSVWQKSTCDGLIFDEDRFLGSPVFSTEEITFGDRKVLIVSQQ